MHIHYDCFLFFLKTDLVTYNGRKNQQKTLPLLGDVWISKLARFTVSLLLMIWLQSKLSNNTPLSLRVMHYMKAVLLQLCQKF